MLYQLALKLDSNGRILSIIFELEMIEFPTKSRPTWVCLAQAGLIPYVLTSIETHGRQRAHAHAHPHAHSSKYGHFLLE